MVNWHIITGEYPPLPGGVSDYTHLLANGLAAAGDKVHVWTPMDPSPVPLDDRVEVHSLPIHFGVRWLRGLHSGIRECPEPSMVLVQYVPHMYGWKAMNIAFCCWLATQRKKNVWVMFHEVAFPFRPGQPWRHDLLALVQRMMAWLILRCVKRSFTSNEHHLQLLERLSPAKTSLDLLPIFSNVPYDLPGPTGEAAARYEVVAKHRHVVGVFSSFGPEICGVLEPVLPKLLENPDIGVLLVGAASSFIHDFCLEHPMFEGRIGTTGRLNALHAGPYLQACDAILQLYPDGARTSRGTLLAALASGVPVVTTSGPLTDRLLRESGAIAFAENNPEAIRATVESLLMDQNLANKLGVRGRQLYEQHFDVRNTIAALRQRCLAEASATSV